ncbi:MAG: 5-(carboxyamino)imidazole ribonucleotide synthase [Pseudomonadota bacterium]
MTDGAAGAAHSLPPGSTIGILGGGQLGRMLAIAAARLGLKCHIYEPAPNPPAGDLAAQVTTAAYDDHTALQAFAKAVDVVTYEFENVPAEALDLIEANVPIRPGRQALAVSQDRADEKTYLEGLGIAVAPWAAVDDVDDLTAAAEKVGLPSILKTRRFGYDGKGQVRLNAEGDLAGALDAIGNAPAVLEGFVPFQREVSVIAARGLAGEVVCFDIGENVHRDGILHTTTVSAATGKGVRTDAALMAGKILNALDYVGVIGAELFVTRAGLLVNEIAPRVHNSGHWTIEACAIDQFQQHIRAICGWPLGDGSRHSDAVMTNLIGNEANAWQSLAQLGGGLHLYGKAEGRPGRKMGHVTQISPKS